jgi:O-antigen ligase
LVVGLVAFVVLVRDRRIRLLLAAAAIGLPMLTLIVFPKQVHGLLAHANGSGQISLRVGAWLTGLRVIIAHPILGIGLGGSSYLLRSAPYRSALQTIPLGHPHDAYLEIGAMAGVPALIVFLALLATGFLLVVRNYRLAETTYYPLLAGGIAAVIALSVNSVAINGWTIQPLATMGWLLMGALASPALEAAITRKRLPNSGATAQMAKRTRRTWPVWVESASARPK